MKRALKYVFSVLTAAVLFVTVLALVLRLTDVKGFENFEYHYIAYMLCGGWGILAFIYMLLARKRLFGWLGVILFIPALVVGAVYHEATQNWMWIPFVALLVAGLVLVFAVFGIKKWDVGDNQKIGYKTYAQRKEEQQAKEKKEQQAIENSRERAKQAAMSKAAAEAAAKAELEFEEKHKK